MDITLTIRSTRRFLCFLCALTSLTRLALGCPQGFLDIIGPGVRVGRGPDWDYEKYGDQDSDVLGTVKSEVISGWVSVEWDNGRTNDYRVGFQDKCDLVDVDNRDIQCNFYQTNLTGTGDFLLSYRTFPRPVIVPYHCSKHIQSPDENKVVALHVLMIDMCNITIDSGISTVSGCDMVSGTYVSNGRDMYIQMYKEHGIKYGFMAYVTYEEKECRHPTPILIASKGVSGYINSPYSKFTLGSRLICLWIIKTDPDQILELTITYQDDERMVDLREDVHLSWKHLRSEEAVHYYTSHTSEVLIRYEKHKAYKSKGFQIVYKTKDKPTKAFCPNMNLQLEPGSNGFLKLPEYDFKSTGSLECKWRLNTIFKPSLIHLTVTRLGSIDFPNHSDNLTINGVSYPWNGSGDKKSFSVTDEQFDISYTKSSANNSIILQYQTETVPLCYRMSSVWVDEEKAFLVVPDAFSRIVTTSKKPCEWNLVSPKNQQVSLEIISKLKFDWEPYKAFAVFENDTWKGLTENKFTSKGNRLLLKHSVLETPQNFSGTLIITYTAVSPATPVMPVVPATPVMPVVPVTPTVPLNQSNTTSSQHLVECTQHGVPIWCYIVIVLLSIASITLIIACYILYRRQIYMCDKNNGALYIRYQDIKANDDQT